MRADSSGSVGNDMFCGVRLLVNLGFSVDMRLQSLSLKPVALLGLRDAFLVTLRFTPASARRLLRGVDCVSGSEGGAGLIQMVSLNSAI